MNTFYSHRSKQVASVSTGPTLSMQQWLLLGRGLWWLLAALYCGLPFVPALSSRLSAQLYLALWWLTLIGLLCLLAELLYALFCLIHRRINIARSEYRYLRIRLPIPRESRYMGSQSAQELWHSLHALFEGKARHHDQPWFGLTLSAAADERVSFGAFVGSQRQSALQEWLITLRRILGGYAPEALIEAADDPLLRACQAAPPGAALAVLELLPSCGPEYLLRTMQEAGSDLLTPLMGQIRPHSAVLYYEVQLALRPRHEPLNTALGWRARAAQRLMRSQHRMPALNITSDSNSIQEKLSAPAYETLLRLCIVAASPGVARQALQEGQAAFAQYTRRTGQRIQQLRPVRRSIQPIANCLAPSAYHLSSISARQPPPHSLVRLLLPFPICQVPAILSSTELAGLWHLPGTEQLGLSSWLSCRYLPSSPQAHVQPDASIADLGPRLILGHSIRSDGSLIPVGPYLRDLRQILHVTAGMGGGKSRLLANLAQQLMQPGFVLIDGKGDDAGNLATTVRKLIRVEDEQRLVILDMSDGEWPVGINPLLTIDRKRQGALDQLSAMLDSLFARIDPETWQQAPGMQQFLAHATRLVIEAEPEPTLLHVQRVLVDETYRRQLLEHASNLELLSFWREVFPKMGEGQRSSMTALLRRFERLLGSELVRGFISQQRSTVRFAEAFEQGLIVVCPIPHVSYGALASTVAMLIFMAMLRAAFERPGTATTRSDYALIIDEFQVLVEQGATQDIATALTQLRSLGIPSIYAHQTLSQIGELRDLLMVNAENRVIIRTQEPDASTYTRHYAASGISAADISSQEPGEHQYARFAVGGHPMPLCSIRPLPWPQAGGQRSGIGDQGTGVAPQYVVSPQATMRYQTRDTRHETQDQEQGQALAINSYSSAEPTQNSKLKTQNLGGDWRSVVSQGCEAQQCYDRELARLCHQPYSAELAQSLAQCSSEDWALIMQRWPMIAQTQRRYILTRPGCIPEQLERQRWLSRLGFARPRVLVEAEYRRLRSGRSGERGHSQ